MGEKPEGKQFTPEKRKAAGGGEEGGEFVSPYSRKVKNKTFTKWGMSTRDVERIETSVHRRP